MEIITEYVQNQLILIVPVGLAIAACILVFTYSIRPAQQPKFLSSLADRKTAGKKKKIKEKKSTANGHVATGAPKSEKSPAKEQKKSPEPPKKEKKPVELQEAKKKVTKKVAVEKPVDFDDGSWETVPTKKTDKKKKTETGKKEKKVKTPAAEVQTVKEETPEKEEIQPVVVEEIEPEVVKNVVEEVATIIEEPAPVVEEKKDKKKKKPKANKQPEEVKTEVAAPKVEVIAPKVEVKAPEVIAAPVEEPKSPPAPAATGAAFDELGDTWKEAKTVKKSKKKARRDN